MRGRLLVRLEHAEGVAVVVREPGGWVWLGEESDGGGTGLAHHRPGVQGLAPAVTLTGGLLPPGAVRAIVHDRGGRAQDAVCGDGAWLALLHQPVRGESPIVRYLDADGAIVSVPLPAGVELAPVDDATVPCPVCGVADWGRVVAAPEAHYGRDGSDRPTAAVCRRCGFEEELAALYAFTSVPEPQALQARRAARDLDAAVRAAPFVVYALAGHEATAAGYGRSGTGVDSASLTCATPAGPVTVWTTVEEWLEPPPWLARDALEACFRDRDEAWLDGSDTAISLWLNARSRMHAAAAAAAPARDHRIPVSGSPTPFATVAAAGRFAAAAALPGATVVVSGHGSPEGLALEPYRGPVRRSGGS